MLKKSENNGTEEIGLVTPTLAGYNVMVQYRTAISQLPLNQRYIDLALNYGDTHPIPITTNPFNKEFIHENPIMKWAYFSRILMMDCIVNQES